MKKYNLVISEKHFNSFHSKYFTNTFTEYFDVSFIERIDKMDSKNCFLVADCMEVITNGKTWCDYLKDQGYLTFVDITNLLPTGIWATTITVQTRHTRKWA